MKMAAPQNHHKLIVRREFLAREFLAVMILALILMGLALAMPAGYTAAEPENTASCELRAPWLIIWLQVLLRYFSPMTAGFIIPLAALIIVACLPWIPRPGRNDLLRQYQFGFHQVIFIVMAAALLCLTFLGL
jgi:quinol-cytochrome oxidoreductase complex cytochrome b subunit